MKSEILIGSGNFWDRLRADMLAAETKVHIQAMTFEGDSVGQAVFDALKASPATDKFLCVDNFSNVVISDDFIRGRRWLLDAEFRDEVRITRQIFSDARPNNIGLFFTNPMGFLFHKYPHRNHKKLMLVDGHIAYVGGINFSEHNFEWHDIMLRIEDSELAAHLAFDYQQTISAKNQSRRDKIGETDVFILDGYRSRGLYEELFEILRTAKKSIKVISPYITWPFLDVIGEQAKNGVDVRIISPQANNKKLLKYYLQYQQSQYPFSIFMYEKKMSHLKAILVDDEVLIMGSTNFDFASYFLEQEYCFVLRDKALVASFKEKVVEDAVTHSSVYDPVPPSFKHRMANRVIRLAIFLLTRMARRIYKIKD